MLNPEWLKYFVTVAETPSFLVAAERLHVTPQAVSKAIAALERHFGQTLVDRGHRVRGLTPAGEALLAEARAQLLGLENIERRMAEMRGEQASGPVRIAGVNPCHTYIVPAAICTLGARYPGIRPWLHVMDAEAIERWVAVGELDLGLLMRAPARPELEAHAGLVAPYVIVGRPQPVRPWHEHGFIVPGQLSREAGGEPLDGWPEASHPRRVVARVERLEARLRLCEGGLGVAYVPEFAVRDRLAAGRLAIVAEPPVAFARQVFLVWRRAAKLTPAAREARAVLCEAIGSRELGP